MFVDKDERTFYTDDNLTIWSHWAIPRNHSGALVLCHGITVDSEESGGIFLQYENELLTNNLAVVRFDFRCHGKSQGVPEDLTLYGEYLDVKKITNTVFEVFSCPIFIQATSFSGSPVIKRFAEVEASFAGLILWNPIIDYRRTFLEESTPWVQEILATRSDKNLPTWAYAKFPGSHYYITQRMVGEFRKDTTPERLKALESPILAFHGLNDNKIPYSFLLELSQGKPNIDLRLLENEGHGFKTNRPFVIRETIAWIKTICQ